MHSCKTDSFWSPNPSTSIIFSRFFWIFWREFGNKPRFPCVVILKLMKTNKMRHNLVNLGGSAHALAIQIMGNSADGADAVQDALTTVLEKPDAYQAAKGPLKPWFMHMVRNRCIDLLRRRRPSSAEVEQLVDPAAGPEKTAEIADRDRALKQALASLDADQRQIVVLRDYMELSYGEIADVLDIAPGTVMSRLHRARVALGAAYRKHND